MIDNPAQAERLLAKLQAALPIATRATPELLVSLQAQASATEMNSACTIVSINYAGDEGGIICQLDFGKQADEAFYTSITHLRFDPPPTTGTQHRNLPEALGQAPATSAIIADISGKIAEPRCCARRQDNVKINRAAAAARQTRSQLKSSPVAAATL